MKTITLNEVQNNKPCYDPSSKLEANWSASLEDTLNLPQFSATEKVSFTMKMGCYSEEILNKLYSFCSTHLQNLNLDSAVKEKLSGELAHAITNKKHDRIIWVAGGKLKDVSDQQPFAQECLNKLLEWIKQ